MAHLTKNAPYINAITMFSSNSIARTHTHVRVEQSKNNELRFKIQIDVILALGRNRMFQTGSISVKSL